MNRVDLVLRTPTVALWNFDHPPASAHCDPEYETATHDSINVVEGGSFDVRVAGGQWRFAPGTIFLAARGMEFSCRHDCDVPTDRCLSVTFGEHATEALMQADVPALHPPMATLTTRQRYLTHRLRSCGAGQELRLELLAGAFFESLAQAGAKATRRKERGVTENMRRIDRAIELIETGYSRALTLQQLAGAAGISAYHFARTFRALAGLPPHRYLTAVRLQHAARLLDDGASVTFTCYETGFASLSHFVNVFRARFGVLPSAVRRGAPCPALRAALSAPIRSRRSTATPHRR